MPITEEGFGQESRSLGCQEGPTMRTFSTRLHGVEGPGMAVVEQARQFLAVSIPTFHGGLKERFLNVARNVAPYIYYGMPE